MPFVGLFHAHGCRWNGLAHRLLLGGPLHCRVDSRRGLIRGRQYQRGFITGITVTADAVLTDAREPFRLGRVANVQVIEPDSSPQQETVVERPTRRKGQARSEDRTWRSSSFVHGRDNQAGI
jgi:hypothetical protein